MGKIPGYQRTIFASEADPGAITRAQSLGNAFANAGRAVGDYYEKQAARKSQTYLTQYESEAAGKLNELRNEFSAEPEKVNDAFKEWSTGRISEITQDADYLSKRFVQRDSERLLSNIQVQNSEWVIQQNAQNAAKDIETQVNNLEIAAINDPKAALNGAYDNSIDATTMTAGTVFSQDKLATINSEARQRVKLSAFEQLIRDGDLSLAKSLAKNKGLQGELGPEGLKRVNAIIHREEKAQARAADNLEKLKFSRPNEYLQRIGAAKGLRPVSLNDSTTFDERLAWIKEKADQYGIYPEKINMFFPQEKEGLIRSIQKGSPAESAQLLGALSEAAPPEAWSKLSKEIFKDNPSYGVAMAIASDDQDTARKIIEGRKLLGSKSYPLPSREIVKEELSSFLGDAIESSHADLLPQIQEAVTSHYLQSAKTKGFDPKDLASDEIKASMEAIIGPVVDINGKKAFSFRGTDGQWVDEDRLEELFEDLNPEILEKVHGDVPRTAKGDPINISEMKSRGKLRTIGDGQYQIQIGQFLLMDKSGRKPFVLDLKKIEDERAIQELERQKETPGELNLNWSFE